MSGKTRSAAVSLGVVVAVLLAVATAAWAYTNRSEGRISVCETSIAEMKGDISEVKGDVKDMRKDIRDMWVDLAGHKAGPPKKE